MGVGFFRLVCAAMVAAVCVGAAPEPAAAPDPAAEALFLAAREARSQSGYAHYSVYATVATFRRAGHPVIRTWETVEDMRRRIVYAHALSREDGAHPHVPHGFNIAGSVGMSVPVAVAPGAIGVGAPIAGISHTFNPEKGDDPIGQLTLAVDQDFGLAFNAPAIAASKNLSEVAAAVTTLPRIGRTGTIARIYDVTDLGDVQAGGVVLHHLGLRPLRDPRRYRLRELWTDATTSLPVRAVVAGIGNRGPLNAVNWRVDFAQLQGGTYITRQTALEPLQSGNGRLDDVTIAFTELRPTNRLTPIEALGLSGDVGTTDP